MVPGAESAHGSLVCTHLLQLRGLCCRCCCRRRSPVVAALLSSLLLLSSLPLLLLLLILILSLLLSLILSLLLLLVVALSSLWAPWILGIFCSLGMLFRRVRHSLLTQTDRLTSQAYAGQDALLGAWRPDQGTKGLPILQDTPPVAFATRL